MIIIRVSVAHPLHVLQTTCLLYSTCLVAPLYISSSDTLHTHTQCQAHITHHTQCQAHITHHTHTHTVSGLSHITHHTHTHTVSGLSHITHTHTHTYSSGSPIVSALATLLRPPIPPTVGVNSRLSEQRVNSRVVTKG